MDIFLIMQSIKLSTKEKIKVYQSCDPYSFIKISEYQRPLDETKVQEIISDFVKNITTKNLIEISQKTKVILLKPVEIKKNIDFQEVFHDSKQEFQRFFHVMF